MRNLSFFLTISVFFIVHFGVLIHYQNSIAPLAQGRSFDDPQTIPGDASFHLLAIQSLRAKYPQEKFNQSQSMEGALKRELREEDFSPWAGYFLKLYPFPSVKSGYALAATFLTAWIPDRIFQTGIRRLAFVNLLLNLLSLCALFLIVEFFTGSVASAVLASAFFIWDVANLYNSYSYLSHTICGCCFLLMAVLLACRRPLFELRWAFVFGFLLSFAALSSPHVFYLVLTLGGFLLIEGVKQKSWRERGRAVFAGLSGAALLPAYFLLVETLFRFQELGIPTLWEQSQEYARAAKFFMADFSLVQRFLWAPKLFHLYFPIVVMLGLGLLGWGFVQKFLRSVSVAKSIPIGHRGKVLGIALASIAALFLTAVYGLPISRVTMPYTLVGGIFFGAWLGRYWSHAYMGRAYIVLILTVTVLSTSRLVGLIGTPMEAPPGRLLFVAITERELSLEAFLKKHAIRKDEPVYLHFDPVQLVSFYVSHRRFYRRYSLKEPELVTPQRVQSDFPLLMEIFEKLTKRNRFAVQTKQRRMWPFSYWDQEHHYLLGYWGHLQKFLVGTPLHFIQPRLIYFLDLRDLLDEEIRPAQSA